MYLLYKSSPHVSLSRCNPSSCSRSAHHRSAAAHDWMSPQARSPQNEESAAPHNRGVRLPHQRHVPVAQQREELQPRGGADLQLDASNLHSFFQPGVRSLLTASWKHPDTCAFIHSGCYSDAYPAAFVIFMLKKICTPISNCYFLTFADTFRRKKDLLLSYDASVTCEWWRFLFLPLNGTKSP